MTVNFKPLNGRVLLEITKTEPKTAGGLFLPDTAKKSDNIGTVVAISSSSKTIGEGVIGKKVMFNEHAPMPIVVEGKTYALVLDTDIFGILED